MIAKLVIAALLSGRECQNFVVNGKNECWKALTLVGTWKILSDDPCIVSSVAMSWAWISANLCTILNNILI